MKRDRRLLRYITQRYPGNAVHEKVQAKHDPQKSFAAADRLCASDEQSIRAQLQWLLRGAPC